MNDPNDAPPVTPDYRSEASTVMIPSEPPESIGAGSVLNQRYEIVRKLGHGGFGVVYLAQDRQILSQRVVIKLLLEQNSGNRWCLEKFQSEVEALSRIDHPGVVGLLDTGETPQGKPFLVMQFVEGENLRSAIPRDGMDLQRAARIIRLIGQALTAAHDKGIYHRDLKPENVILQNAGGEEALKLIDFGIATVKDSETGPNRQTTAVAGTVRYMAPEQFVGKPTHKSDIYALGVIAYELVTGRTPFQAISALQLQKSQQAGPQVHPKALRPDLPEQADRLILTALSYQPALRPDNARAFGDELAAALETEEDLALPTAPQAADRPRSRRTVWLGTLAVVLLILAAVAVFSSRRSAPRASSLDSLAVLPFTNESSSPEIDDWADGLSRDLRNTFSRFPQLLVKSESAVRKYAGKHTIDPRSTGKALEADALLMGSIAQTATGSGSTRNWWRHVPAANCGAACTIAAHPRSLLFKTI